MNGNPVGPGRGKVLQEMIRFVDHQVDVQRKCGYLSKVSYDCCPDGNGWHEAAIHNVDVDPVCASFLNGADLVTKAGKIG
jgi:hypothetical protein